MEDKKNKVQNVFNQIGWYSFFALFPFGTNLVGGIFLLINQLLSFKEKKQLASSNTHRLVRLINKFNYFLLFTLFISAFLAPIKKEIALLSTLAFSLVFLTFINGGQQLAASEDLFKKNYIPLLGLASILAAFLAIIKYFSLHMDRANLFGPINAYSYIIIICSGLFIGYSLYKADQPKYLLPLFLIINSLALILNQSRGGWLGFISMITTFAFFNKKILIIFLIICLVCGGIFLSSDQLKNRLMSITSIEENIGRIYIWQSTLKIIKDYPIFGIGAGVYPFIYDKYVMPGSTERQMCYAHNLPLQILAEFGIVGFILFCINIFTILFMSISLVRRKNIFYQAILAIFVGILIQHQFDVQIWVMDIAGAFWLLEGLIIGFYQQEFSKPKTLDKIC